MSTQRPNLDTGAQWRELGALRRWQSSGSGQSEGDRRRQSRAEKFGSLLGGSALAAVGVSRRSWPGLAMAAAGGFLIYHGARGRSGPNPIRVQVSFTINKPLEEVWNFWRNFENLPRFMTHLQEVRPTSHRHSHWTAKSPAGTVSWNAEIVDEREHEFLVWRSVQESDIETRGSVEFRRAPGNRGTEIHVAMDYRVPGGRLSAAVASLFGESAGQQVREDLRHFKQLLETGEIPSTVGQPHGRRSLAVKAAHAVWHEPEERQTLTMPRSA